ncbi:MAG: FHA domain-containing protein [Armatimonadia bacterium]
MAWLDGLGEQAKRFFTRFFDRGEHSAIVSAAVREMVSHATGGPTPTVPNIYVIEIPGGTATPPPKAEEIKQALEEAYMGPSTDPMHPSYRPAGGLKVEVLEVFGAPGVTVHAYFEESHATLPKVEASVVGLTGSVPGVRLEVPGEVYLAAGGQDQWYVARDPVEKEFRVLVPSPDGDVSRRHAVIRMEGPDQFTLEDLNSTNGTWLDDTRVSPGTRVPLPYGSTVRLGTACLRFERLLPLRARLRSVEGVAEPFDVRLDMGRPTWIGRAADCNVRIGAYAQDVSKRHAELRPEGNGFCLRDLSSTNGTRHWSGDEPESLLEAGDTVLLKTGDRIALGEHVVLEYFEE